MTNLEADLGPPLFVLENLKIPFLQIPKLEISVPTILSWHHC